MEGRAVENPCWVRRGAADYHGPGAGRLSFVLQHLPKLWPIIVWSSQSAHTLGRSNTELVPEYSMKIPESQIPAASNREIEVGGLPCDGKEKGLVRKHSFTQTVSMMY